MSHGSAIRHSHIHGGKHHQSRASGQKGNKTKKQLEPATVSMQQQWSQRIPWGEKRTRCYLPGLKVKSDDKNEGAAGWDFLELNLKWSSDLLFIFQGNH